MLKKTWIIAAFALVTAAACMDGDAECAVGGALAGAAIGELTGGNATNGALIGAGAGVVANNQMGTCR